MIRCYSGPLWWIESTKVKIIYVSKQHIRARVITSPKYCSRLTVCTVQLKSQRCNRRLAEDRSQFSKAHLACHGCPKPNNSVITSLKINDSAVTTIGHQ